LVPIYGTFKGYSGTTYGCGHIGVGSSSMSISNEIVHLNGLFLSTPLVSSSGLISTEFPESAINLSWHDYLSDVTSLTVFS